MKRLFVLIFSVLCLSLGMQAKDNSVAYVDMAYILKNLPQYETANEQLTMIAKRWQKEVDALEQEIRVMTTNYQAQVFRRNRRTGQKTRSTTQAYTGRDLCRYSGTRQRKAY